MKKLVFALSLIVAASFGLNAQVTGGITTTDAAVPADGPKISLDKDVHDYGTIEQGAEGTCVFKVTNTGNAPLIISTCKGSCGCTVPKCTKEPVAPGASTEISVHYDTKRVGAINKTVTITSNAVDSPRKVIRIKGMINAKPTGGAPTNAGSPVVN
ncbi:DUF1573 domain-containing protein [Crocinitomix catalasitica]|uniref:DUF1573 domain-containing protein n=1 Tax=Crocinitomix catalasitica TaxID=184607 RepID=UPI0004859789|nr:DUF1573 domain-containing protein [Crocinitomix catalasitica]